MDPKEFKKLLGTTDKFIKILNDNGIQDVQDLLWYFPRAYEDRRSIKTLSEVMLDDTVQTVKAKVIKKNLIRTPRGKQLAEIQIEDEQGTKGRVAALNGNYLLRQVTPGKRYYIIGKPQMQSGKAVFWHPEVVEAATDETTNHMVGRIYPIYPELQGIKSGWFAKRIYNLMQSHLPEMKETLPQEFLDMYGLRPLNEIVSVLHDPHSLEEVDEAKYRVFFERLLKMQLLSLISKQEYVATKESSEPDRDLVKEFNDTLPFELTGAQKRALKQVIDDFHSGTSMMRLMQGDVGSGKTVVATAASYYIIKKWGGQVAFLAPIEVLAIQHFRTLAKLLLPLGIRMELLTGATKPAEKERIKSGLAQGTINMVVGTHAIIQDDMDFHDLQFAIVDEQHKFGVRQRAFFHKFNAPHLLQMTATPIPRSLALAFFGEFQVSNIDEMPAGRKPITTKIITKSEMDKLKPWILTKIGQDQRVFLITPLIEESEHLDEIANAHEMYEYVHQKYPELQGKIGLLHGKMKSEEKQQVMQDFKSGKTVFLVSTTVIEVGIDVPEATVMIIKNSERFGISQLHQLRGRVGRSDLQSYCFLHTKSKSGESYQRLKHLEESNDGFHLSEVDLQIRGSGEILGVRQAGATDIPLSILTDTKFLEKVQEGAIRLLDHHESLVKSEFLVSELQDKMDGLLV